MAGAADGAANRSVKICENLVQYTHLSWNTIEPSLVLMYEKLVALGFVYYNGEIHVVEPETEGSEYHD